LAFGVREKIMAIFMVLLFIPIILLGFVSVYEVRDVGNQAVEDSRDSLSGKAEKHLMALAYDKANETNNFFESIEVDTRVLTDFANDVYNNPENYHNGTNYPTYRYSGNTVPYLPDWGYVHTANDERRGAWSDWDSKVQTTPYLNSSVVKMAETDPAYAKWLRDEINKTVLFDHMFKPVYDKNQPNVVLVWMVREGGLTNSYSTPPLDYGEMLAAGDLTDDWDEDAEDYVTLANAVNNPTKGIVWTDPYFDTVGNGWLISCLGPIYYDGYFIGDVGIDIQLDVLNKIVLGVQILETGHAFLINKNGEAVAHPDLEDVRAQQMAVDEEDIYVDISRLESNTAEFNSLVSKMTTGGRGLSVVEFESGEKQYVAYMPIESTDLSIGVVISEKEINALVDETEQKMNDTTSTSVLLIIIIVVVTVLLVIIASVVLAGRITKPIKQLTMMADNITKGNLNYDVNADFSDEMQTLAKSFHNLLITLRLGNVAYYEGDTRRAFENYKSALSLFSATGNRSGQSMSLNNLGNIYRSWKDYQNALKHYNKAISLDRKDKNLNGEASRLTNLGLLYKESGNPNLAKKNFHEAFAIYKRTNNMKGKARVYNNMALMALEEKRPDLAMNYFVKAYEIDVAQNDRRGLSSRLNNLAMMYKTQNQQRKALSFLNKSMELSRSYEDKTGVMNNLLNISKVYGSMGDRRNEALYEKKYKEMREKVLSTSRRKTVIFVLDSSGSMAGERMAAAKKGAMNLFNRKVYDTDMVSLIEFFSESNVVLPPMTKAEAKKKFQMALHKVYADGMTAMYDALGDALTLISKSQDPHMSYWIVALTDGEDNSSFRFNKKSVCSTRDTIPQDVTIVMISVGDAVMRSDLEELCGANGTYIVVGQEGDAKIGREIQKAYKEVEDIFESSEVVEGFVPEG
jgi:Mg-chelatase subunit ChlD/HAMP domain-containing protein